MKIIPTKTRIRLIVSAVAIFSLRKNLAWIVVNIGEVADIIIQSAKGKCYKKIECLEILQIAILRAGPNTWIVYILYINIITMRYGHIIWNSILITLFRELKYELTCTA